MQDTKVRNTRVLGPRHWPSYFVVTTLLTASVLWVAGSFTHARPWSDEPITTVCVFLVIAAWAITSIGRCLLLPHMARPKVMPPEPGLRVAAVTTYVPGDEPLEMLEETLTAMVSMRYDHDCWLLDEG